MQCTAIGKIVSMYYILHVYTNYGCCTNKDDAKIHLIFHSRTPLIVKSAIIPPPHNWNPNQFPLITYQNMSAYLYLPDPKIPFLNHITAPMMAVQNQFVNSMGSNNNSFAVENNSTNRMTE